VRVLRYLYSWQGSLDDEAFFERDIVPVDFDPALDKIEEGLVNLSTRLELPVEVSNLP
jgi:hypothetical protein